ncbi:MAG: retropepsin-like aspartic protease family protein, partial [Opitutales bacterium]|nr:retropepsin-like aspartic protease family protein [Opitutales bacterium]
EVLSELKSDKSSVKEEQGVEDDIGEQDVEKQYDQEVDKELVGRFEFMMSANESFQLAVKQWEQLPLFTGQNKTAIDEWISKARTAMTNLSVHKISMQQLIGLVESKLIGAAQTWTKGLTEEELSKFETITDYLEALRARFEDATDRERAEEELFSVRQGNRRVVTYWAELKNIHAKSGLKHDEAYLKGIFYNELQPEIKNEMKRMHYKTLQECNRAAEKAESMLTGGDTSQGRMTEQAPRAALKEEDAMDLSAVHGKFKKSSHDGRKKHSGPAPANRNKQGQFAKNITCNYCRKKGHMLKDCWVKTRHMQELREMKKREKSNRMDLGAVETKSEEQENNTTSSYIAGVGSQGDSLVFLTGFVERERVRFLLDTGASQNIIRKSLADKLELKKIDEAQRELRFADGRKQHGIERVSVNIRVEDWREETEAFYVADIQYDAILGLPWIQQNCVKIEAQGKKVEVTKDGETVTVDTKMTIPMVSGKEILSEMKQGEETFAIYLSAVDLKKESEEEDARVEAILTEYCDRFEKELPPGLPPHRNVNFSVTLEEGALPPSAVPYRHSPVENEEIRQQISTMLERGLIRPLISEYAAPVIVVK